MFSFEHIYQYKSKEIIFHNIGLKLCKKPNKLNNIFHILSRVQIFVKCKKQKVKKMLKVNNLNHLIFLIIYLWPKSIFPIVEKN